MYRQYLIRSAFIELVLRRCPVSYTSNYLIPCSQSTFFNPSAYRMGWSIENILAFLTLVIIIPTTIIDSCAIFNWWRHRRISHSIESSGRSPTPDPQSAHNLEMVPVPELGPPRTFPQHSYWTASSSLEEGVTSVSYDHIHYYGKIEVRRPAPQPWRL
ncbi:hypothetical protein BJX68DRAFT_227816 [Aspergillus pseudodeflectus]|uniref:Uncharacterized protein n=1 Tax=Aspergillus pseudodeflectus TaxID=176178 RepID=A0ABR4L6K8_9EURO